MTIEKTRNNKKLITTLVILLILLAGYILVDKYSEAKAEERLNIYQKGIQDGFGQAIVQVMEQVSTCQQVPLFAGNVSLNVVAVECLEK
ncbi:hypothetical protein KY321_00980 [Candidatus Woesearchaeota archaeon]|nr:hypothetical protein [Candidatus Woesearchaeota archaeon]